MEKTEHLMEQITTEKGRTFLESQAWEHLSDQERAGFQLLQDVLWMPFSTFQDAVESALGRPVEIPEFGFNRHGLINELFQDTPPPTLQDILDKTNEDGPGHGSAQERREDA